MMTRVSALNIMRDNIALVGNKKLTAMIESGQFDDAAAHQIIRKLARGCQGATAFDKMCRAILSYIAGDFDTCVIEVKQARFYDFYAKAPPRPASPEQADPLDRFSARKNHEDAVEIRAIRH